MFKSQLLWAALLLWLLRSCSNLGSSIWIRCRCLSFRSCFCSCICSQLIIINDSDKNEEWMKNRRPTRMQVIKDWLIKWWLMMIDRLVIDDKRCFINLLIGLHSIIKFIGYTNQQFHRECNGEGGYSRGTGWPTAVLLGDHVCWCRPTSWQAIHKNHWWRPCH